MLARNMPKLKPILNRFDGRAQPVEQSAPALCVTRQVDAVSRVGVLPIHDIIALPGRHTRDAEPGSRVGEWVAFRRPRVLQMRPSVPARRP